MLYPSGGYNPDAWLWDSVPFADFRELPNTCGLYACVTLGRQVVGKEDVPGSVLYVGQSTCIRERWVNGHHKAIDAMIAGATHIAWMEVPPAKLNWYETDMIRRWDPLLNEAPGPKIENVPSVKFSAGVKHARPLRVG